MAAVASRAHSVCRTRRSMLLGPLEGVVSDLLPAFTTNNAVVGTPRKLLVVGDRLGVAVMLDVGLVDRGRHDIVPVPRYEQQRRPILVAEVHVGFLVARREVRQRSGPYQPARGG